MTEQQITDLVDEWKNRLGLQNWDIEVPFGQRLRDYWNDQGDSKSSYASIHRSKHYLDAKIYVNPDDFQNWSAEEGRNHLVHELVHCLLSDIEFALDLIEGELPKETESFIDSIFVHYVERATDQIARQFIKAYADEDTSY